MKNLIILIVLSFLFTGCVTTDRISGNAKIEANDGSHTIGGEIHYKLFEW